MPRSLKIVNWSMAVINALNAFLMWESNPIGAVIALWCSGAITGIMIACHTIEGMERSRE